MSDSFAELRDNLKTFEVVARITAEEMTGQFAFEGNLEKLIDCGMINILSSEPNWPGYDPRYQIVKGDH